MTPFLDLAPSEMELVVSNYWTNKCDNTECKEQRANLAHKLGQLKRTRDKTILQDSAYAIKVYMELVRNQYLKSSHYELMCSWLIHNNDFCCIHDPESGEYDPESTDMPSSATPLVFWDKIMDVVDAKYPKLKAVVAWTVGHFPDKTGTFKQKLAELLTIPAAVTTSITPLFHAVDCNCPGKLDQHLYQQILNNPEQALPLIDELQQIAPDRKATQLVMGIADVLRQKTSPADMSAWYWLGRFTQLPEEKALVELQQNAEKPEVRSVFYDKPYSARSYSLATKLATMLCKTNPKLVLQLFPKAVWWPEQASILAYIQQLFLVARITNMESCPILLSLLDYWPKARVKAEIQLLRTGSKFEEALQLISKQENTIDLKWEQALCNAKIADVFHLDIPVTTEFVQQQSELEKVPGCNCPEYNMFQMLLAFSQKHYTKVVSLVQELTLRDLPRKWVNRYNTYTWLTCLLTRKIQTEQFEQACIQMERCPEELAIIPDLLLQEAMLCMHAYPQATAKVSALLLAHLPNVLDTVLIDHIVIQQPALRQRMLQVCLDNTDIVDQWFHLRKLTSICVKSNDIDLLLTILDVLETAVNSDNDTAQWFKQDFLKRLLDIQHLKLPSPWNAEVLQYKIGLLYWQLNKPDDAAGYLVPLLQKAIHGQDNDKVSVILAELTEHAPLSPIFSELIPTAPKTVQPTQKVDVVTQYTATHPLSVFYIGGDWEEKHESWIRNSLQVAYPNITLCCDHSAWGSDIDNVLNKIQKFDLLVISCYMRTNNGYRIRAKARELNKVFAKSDGRGRASIFNAIVTALTDYTMKRSPIKNSANHK